ncbi:lysylphosphatidylglycerol synthase transmembrane domain-containing protein [Aeromicrobium sp.]|uniref:lysylphosphatidylglycerol synthase transmembrane domain-containing protein n=1 Tax=Aeromicrobium sp. TaxID=1871063 RepID=UPI003D6B7606
MSRSAWRSVRLAVGAAVLGAVLWRTGTGPFVGGLRSLDLWTLALGAALAVPVTIACAWRWHLVARELGVGVDMGPAVASCYRAQFLNTTLPGGIVGDVHRGVRHGRDAGDAGRGLRAVVWERLAGQVVQVAIAIVVLLLLPSPVRSSVPAMLGVLAAGFVAAALVVRQVPLTGRISSVSRMLRAVRDDVRSSLLVRRVWPGVVLATTVAVAFHLSTYFVAARAVGVTTSPLKLLPLALLVLLAAGLPLNIAGWGPREGMAAWSFGAAGLGADQGVATAVAYGVIVLVANLPGAVVLVVASGRRGDVRSVEPSPSGQPHVAEGDRAHG